MVVLTGEDEQRIREEVLSNPLFVSYVLDNLQQKMMK